MVKRKLLGFGITLVLLPSLLNFPVSGVFPGEEFTPKTGEAGPQTDSVVISDIGLESIHPAVAYNSMRDEYLVVWYNDRPSNDDIQAQRLDKNGKLLGGKFYIATGANHERRFPDVAYDSKNDQYLVVWQDFNSATMISGDAIYGRRVSGSGDVLDTIDIVIKGTGARLFLPQKPKVDYSNKSDKFLVVWEDTTYPITVKKDILGKIVLPNGTTQGEDILISDDQGNGDYRQAPDVVYNRLTNRFMVVFEQFYSSQNVWGISGQQLTGEGALWQSNFIIEYGSADATEPRVAALYTYPRICNFIVTYKFGNGSDTDIIRIFIEGDSSLGNKAFVTRFDYNENNPAIAANESSNNFLISWTQPNPEESPPYDIISMQKYTFSGTSIGESIDIAGKKTDNSAIASGLLGDYLIVYDQLQFGYDILGVLYRQVDWQIFQDVGSSDWAFDWINRLYAAGVTTGCNPSPLKYCPEHAVTRAQMAIFLERGMHDTTYSPPPATGLVFSDISTSSFAANWIEVLYADGITSGCDLNPLRYCPDASVTRAQMAIFLLRAKYGKTYTPPPVGVSTGFMDVPPTDFAAAWIKQLAAEGITSGCGGGNYCPNDPVTRAQMAVFLVKTFELP
jgi:hypothetical protein